MYKSVVNLIPHFETVQGFRGRIFDWAFKRYETVAYSIDDAVSLVSNARSDSLIRVWNANFLSEGDIMHLTSSWGNLEWWHLPGYIPNVNNALDSLPTGAGAYRTRTPEDIFFIAIHHTVGWDYSRSTKSNAVSIATGHSKKWPGIGYHYLIGPDGEIVQTNSIKTVSYHVGTLAAPEDENKQSIGIALGGNFQFRQPPEAQWGAASALVAHLRNTPNYLAVVPHKRSAGAATVCPGVADLEWWLKRVAGTETWI